MLGKNYEYSSSGITPGNLETYGCTTEDKNVQTFINLFQLIILVILLPVFSGCTLYPDFERDKLPLAGEWKFKIDSLDNGINDISWPGNISESVILPGSMAENGKGEEIKVTTDWTGSINDKSYFTDKKYEKYRQPGNIKIPFWLKPVKYYKGVAWYQKTVVIPEKWCGKRVFLFLERCHWESTVFINGKEAGRQNSLSTPHEYDITEFLVKGSNIISIRIDNRVKIPIGEDSHSISDNTQSNWNGITGDIYLYSTSPVYINDIKVFPDIRKKSARLIVSVVNRGNTEFKGELSVRANSFNTGKTRYQSRKNVTIVTKTGEQQVELEYKIRNPLYWNEFSPALYKITVGLEGDGNCLIDQKATDFGMREFKANGTRFEVNEVPIFLRGTTECCIFPLTGYPPCGEGEWEKVLRTCRDYGMNHIRFHSFCPPEAAFKEADKLGIYFHIECGVWTRVGEGGPTDQFIYDEGDRILKAYGNHPSFCMLAYGNEPGGKNRNAFLGELVKYWRSKDNRRTYTSAAGWPAIPENDYHISGWPRLHNWPEGPPYRNKVNLEAPETMVDFRDFISKNSVPVLGHEIGQWCVYPDYNEINQYTGVLKPTNFEIFRNSLEENKMGQQAHKFLMASGKLQLLCYKADIEASLRTPGYAGFQMLQLHDFPGQGTALVGVLNALFQSKDYVTPEEFMMFCNQTVPLARLKKMVYKNNEQLTADLEISHFGPAALKDVHIKCRLTDADGKEVLSQVFEKDIIEIGNCIPAGRISTSLSGISRAQKLKLEVAIENTPFRNTWEVWVYPDKVLPDPGAVNITDKLDKNAVDVLGKGGSVLLLISRKIAKEKGGEIQTGFSPVFWNTSYFKKQSPTLGLLIDKESRLFDEFPTEYHSNLQWWDPVMHSKAMILNDLPANLTPLIQPIDTWFENRKLALLFETRTGNGKLMVCSIDLESNLNERPVSKQLLFSLLKYMNTDKFDPGVNVEISTIRKLITD